MNKTTLIAAAALTALFTAAQPAFAQSSNLNLWTAAGDTQITSPTSALITTASTLSGETPLTANSALLFDELESALSISGATAGDTFEGSGFAQNFVVAAGFTTTISFNWTLSTVDFDPAFADRAFLVVDGTPAVNFAVVGNSPLSGSFSYTFTTAGNHSLAVAVMDVNDTVGVSTLTLSNLSVSAVPEASSIAMMLTGLALVRAAARRRRG